MVSANDIMMCNTTITMNLIIDENVDLTSLDMMELERQYKKVEIIDDKGTIKKGTKDEALVQICKTGKYDLLTGDQRQYSSFLVDDSDIVKIRKYKFNENSKQMMYLVRWESSS